MAEKADIVIIGAGVIGLCAAFQCALRSRAKIIVLDKGAGPGEGSTGASSAVCRFKYSHGQMVELARDGINAYRNWPEFLGLREPLARFHSTGVLWMSDGNEDWPGREAERLAGFGVRSEVLDDQSVQERFPALNPCVTAPDLLTGAPHQCRGGGRHLLELDGGYFDPVDALQDLVAAARGRGVDVRFRTGAGGITVESGRVTGVTLKSGERIECGSVVNAAGPWCNAVFEMAGLAHGWPLAPCRIQMVQIDRPADVHGDIPVCVDLTAGIYFRPQSRSRQLIVGSVLEEDEKEFVADPDDYARYADDEFMRAKLHALQHRVHGLSVRGVRGYSGLYTVNRADMHPVVGRTEIAGFYAANGFSGHGFKLAPAIGSLLARAILGEGGGAFDTDVDPDFLSIDREPIELESKSVLA